MLGNLGRFENRHAYHYCTSYFQSISSPSEALIRIQEIAEKEGVASITPPRIEGPRELYEEQFLVFVEIERLREKAVLRNSLSYQNTGPFRSIRPTGSDPSRPASTPPTNWR